MAGLVRYIILPICLWWLITGGYEVFLEGDFDQPQNNEPRPAQPAVQKPKPPVLTAETAPKNEPATEKAPLPKAPTHQSNAVSKQPTGQSNAECKAIKNALLQAERDDLIIDLRQLERGIRCDLSGAQKRSLIKHTIRLYASNNMYANALEVAALYQQTFPSDPDAYFWESQIHQAMGTSNRSVTAFVKGYKLSDNKKKIAPRHFLVALKSMQSLQLVCEQINVMRAMTRLEQLDSRAKAMIAQQIQALTTQCG